MERMPGSSKAVAAVLLVVLTIVYIKRRSRSVKPKNLVLVHCRETESPKEVEQVNERLNSGLRFFQQCNATGSIVGRGGVSIRYAKFQSPSEKAIVLFLTGWSESMLKYGDMFKELCQNGCTVVALDHRSQGFSERPARLSKGKLDSLKTHVEDFDDHVTDALLVINQIVAPMRGKLYIMGFSLGGLVAARVATMVKCAGLILVAPCLLPYTGYPTFMVKALTSFLRAIGKGEDFVPGHPFGLDHRMLPPPRSRVSSSSARIQFWERLRLETSDVCINGMSVAHLDELIRAGFRTAHCRQLLADRILVLSADLDEFVENREIFAFSETASAQVPCRHVHINGAKHELLHEREEIRARVMDEIGSFIMW